MMLEQPIRIGGLTAQNRLVMPPMQTNKTQQGHVTDEMVAYYREHAVGSKPGVIKEELLRHRKQLEANRRAFRNGYSKKWLNCVCVDSLGNLIIPDKLTQRFGNLLKANGLRHIRFHDLRHPYVKLTTKKYLLQKQKSQVPLPITWGFCFLLYSKRSCTLYSISIRLSGCTRTLLIRRSASAAVRPVASSSSFEMLLRWASFSFASCSRFA